MKVATPSELTKLRDGQNHSTRIQTQRQKSATVFGRLFVFLEMLVIATIYYTYVVLLWGPRALGKFSSMGIVFPSLR